MNAVGEWGEIYTARYLRERGYQIVASNYRCRFGEADIISIRKKTMVVTEVKARSGKMIARPAEFVGNEKQRKLALTAASFAAMMKYDYPIRFDVAEVIFPESDNYKVYKINYMEDAFRV